MAKLGVLPTQVYTLTVGEINVFLTQRSVHEAELSISSAWRTINFLGALLNDKFRNLERYLPETPKRRKKIEAQKAKLEKQLENII